MRETSNHSACMMSGQHGRWGVRAPAGLALGIAFLLSGCGKETPTGPPLEFPSPLIARNVHVIDESSGISLYEKTDSTLVFTITELIPRHIAAGDIVIGAEEGGYMRRIVAARTEGGQMILQTIPACLTDAVITGGVGFEIETGFGSSGAAAEHIACTAGSAFSGGGLSISGLTIFEGEIGGTAASISIEEGYIEFDPVLTTRAVIFDGTINEIRSVAEGTLTADLDLSFDIPGETALSREILLASVKQTTTHFIGAVPIVAQVDLDLYMECAFSGTYVGGCVTGVRSSFDFSLGGIYEGRRWSGVSSLEAGVTGTRLTCVDFATAEVRVTVRPVITVHLYEETAALMRLDAYCDVTADTGTPPVWEWSIHGGLESSYDITPHILDAHREPFRPEPLFYEILLAEGPYTTDYYVFLYAWGSEGTGDYQFAYPRGITHDGSGNIYVVDAHNNRIQKFSADSTFILRWGTPGEGEGQFIMPASVAVDEAGNIYVTDSGNNRVQKFGPDTSFVTEWGERGSEPAQFNTPAGITADPAGNIYVVDSGNNRVQKFTNEGLLLGVWGSFGSGADQFATPIGIASDGEGNIYVTDCHNARVQKFAPDGEFITAWGTAGTRDGEFDCPVAVAVDGAGNVYILDYGNDRLQKYDSSGALITTLGGPGTGEGQFDHPEGVTVDVLGNIYIADSRNARVQKFAPIPRIAGSPQVHP